MGWITNKLSGLIFKHKYGNLRQQMSQMAGFLDGVQEFFDRKIIHRDKNVKSHIELRESNVRNLINWIENVEIDMKFLKDFQEGKNIFEELDKVKEKSKGYEREIKTFASQANEMNYEHFEVERKRLRDKAHDLMKDVIHIRDVLIVERVNFIKQRGVRIRNRG